jgi:hypothetical protein
LALNPATDFALSTTAGLIRTGVVGVVEVVVVLVVAVVPLEPPEGL